MSQKLGNFPSCLNISNEFLVVFSVHIMYVNVVI